MAEQHQQERRKGPKTRRIAMHDRRNPERLAEDVAPQRNPEVPGRRDYDKKPD